VATHRHNHVVQKGYLNLFAEDELIDCHFVPSGRDEANRDHERRRAQELLRRDLAGRISLDRA
jgi:hypothetical protein